MEKPQITFPSEVRAFVLEQYAQSSVILEYGSGGSTVSASEMPEKTIFSVESDRIWAENLRKYIANSEKTLSTPVVQYVDIGPTKEWGHPVSDSNWRNFHKYAMSIWLNRDFKEPDIVLIDGRFRVACFLTCILFATKSTKILVDDYTARENYHVVEEYAKLTATVDRMAVFDVSPKVHSRDFYVELTRYLMNPS